MLREGSIFRRVAAQDDQTLKLAATNPNYQERVIPRADVRQMWRLTRHIRNL